MSERDEGSAAALSAASSTSRFSCIESAMDTISFGVAFFSANLRVVVSAESGSIRNCARAATIGLVPGLTFSLAMASRGGSPAATGARGAYALGVLARKASPVLAGLEDR